MTNRLEPTITDVRTFWDNRPCNIHHSQAPIGTRQYFDEVERKKYFVEPHIPAFAEFEKWKGKDVLEIGCGIGTDAVNFARAGAHYTGVELSEKSLALTKRRFEIFDLHGRFFQGNAEDLTSFVPLKPFDLVYSFGVVHHSVHPEKIIEQVAQYLEPTSEFRLMLYAKHSWKHAMIEAGLDQPEAAFGCPIANTYTHDEVRRLLGGFEILSIEQDHIFPFVVEKYVQQEYEVQPWFKVMPEKMFHALEKTFGWHTLIKATKI